MMLIPESQTMPELSDIRSSYGKSEARGPLYAAADVRTPLNSSKSCGVIVLAFNVPHARRLGKMARAAAGSPTTGRMWKHGCIK
jgi:hypothetical protein